MRNRHTTESTPYQIQWSRHHHHIGHMVPIAKFGFSERMEANSCRVANESVMVIGMEENLFFWLRIKKLGNRHSLVRALG